MKRTQEEFKNNLMTLASKTGVDLWNDINILEDEEVSHVHLMEIVKRCRKELRDKVSLSDLDYYLSEDKAPLEVEHILHNIYRYLTVADNKTGQQAIDIINDVEDLQATYKNLERECIFFKVDVKDVLEYAPSYEYRDSEQFGRLSLDMFFIDAGDRFGMWVEDFAHDVNKAMIITGLLQVMEKYDVEILELMAFKSCTP